VRRSASAVLSALISASEDSVASVAAEAVASLTKVVRVTDFDTIGPNLINICFRMRPAFDRKDINVRTAAFTLFAALSRFGKPESKEEERRSSWKVNQTNFLDQVHANVPIYVVHVNDEDSGVRAACLSGLRVVAELLGDEVKTVCDEATCEPDAHDDFVCKLAPTLTRAFADRLRSYTDAAQLYFQSKEATAGGGATTIIANAAMMTGAILANTTADDRARLNVASLVAALVNLVRHDHAGVRSKAVKALSLLHSI